MEKEIYENLGKTDKCYLYGSDIPGSMFEENTNFPWNLNNIETVLNEGLGNKKLKGITTPYLYIGGYGTLFAWHVEDYNLPSINYLHYG